MGLFGGGNSKSSQNSTTKTSNYADNRIYQSDYGAIESAFGFAGDAVSLASGVARDAIASNENTLGDALRESLGFGRESFEVASSALRESLDFADTQTDRAISTSERSYETALGFGADIFDRSISAVSNVLSDGQQQLGSTVTALNSIAREQATSTDQRVQDIAKNALYVGGAVVVVIALVMIFK